MSSAQESTRTAGPDPQAEAIDVVIGRFQNWKNAQSPTGVGSSLGARTDSRWQPGEAREVSYEQALKASRYRPKSQGIADRSLSSLPLSKPGSARDAEATTPSEESAQPGVHRPPVISAQPGIVAAPITVERATGSVAKQTAPAKVPNRKQPSIPRMQAAAISAPLSSSPAKKSTTRRNAAKVSAQATVVKMDGQADATLKAPKRTARALPKSKPPAFASITRDHLPPPPALREVANAVTDLAASHSEEPINLESTKATSITLRVSDDEQARIQACAASANLSVSAYLRQCALGVDNLRGQVEFALTQLRQQPTPVIATPGMSAIPGILRRFGALCWRRLQGRDLGHTAISLR